MHELLQCCLAYAFLAVAHSEERCLQYVYVAFPDEFGEELQEECNHEQAYVHAVDIGIGCNYHFVVAQAVDSVFDVECCLQQVELLVFIHHLLSKSVGVERLASQREDGLGLHVAALGDASACRVTLGDEYAAVFLAVALGVVEVYAAVAQLAVVEVGLLGAFACQLCHSGNGLAVALAVGYLLLYHFGHVEVLVQVVVDFGLDEVAHKLVHTHPAAGFHGE